jgi:CheY-like chemotaxis protein
MAQPHRTQVLVVEEHPLIRIVACDALAAKGITALEAGNADEAQDVLASHPLIGLVFTDVHAARRKDDLAFVRKLRIVRPDVELIVTSAAVTNPEEELPSETAFLLKPYPVNMLVEIITTKLADLDEG